jgi:hypothetical protein
MTIPSMLVGCRASRRCLMGPHGTSKCLTVPHVASRCLSVHADLPVMQLLTWLQWTRLNGGLQIKQAVASQCRSMW